MFAIMATAIATLWNTLGDLAATVFAWGLWWILEQLEWLPLPIDGDVVFWHLAVPLTLGFLIEHVAQWGAQILATKGVGVTINDKGGLNPIVVPASTNWLVFLAWNIAMWCWPVLLVGLVLVTIFLIVRARRAHP